ncbi:hypothetical protein BKD26_23865 [Streptomyces sp. CB03238]|nr:hypothetical protein BKD26_23865 [Streptomyces sp. CB03238]
MTVGLLAGGGAVAGVTPAWAEAPAPAAVPAGSPADQLTRTMSQTVAEDARRRVLVWAKTHPAAEVRVSAWNALRHARGDEAIAQWLAPGGGFDYAKQRARDTRSRNKAFCERVVRTHTVEFSPEVRAAAGRALKGTAADQAAFVKSGYAEAQRRDRVAREADAQHRRDVTAKDRDLVRTVAAHDPGEQVRVAAQWALRDGAGDADIAEFFGYGWLTGASLDLDGHRARTADAEASRHHALSRLTGEAVAAEQALKGATDAAKARAEAERAWKAVAEHAGAARRAWLAEQAAAMAQAENWKNIAKAARESADGLGKHISGPAETNQGLWTGEQTEAAEAAAFWQDMAGQALAGEKRVQG